MARARSLKPAFFRNEHLIALPFEARLLFAGLWTLADREGRLEDRPLRIRLELFPGDSVDVDHLLTLLADSEGQFITRFAVDGQRCIQITNFTKHQNPHHREPESALPEPISEKPRASLRPALDLPEASPGLAPDQPQSSLNISRKSEDETAGIL